MGWTVSPERNLWPPRHFPSDALKGLSGHSPEACATCPAQEVTKTITPMTNVAGTTNPNRANASGGGTYRDWLTDSRDVRLCPAFRGLIMQGLKALAADTNGVARRTAGRFPRNSSRSGTQPATGHLARRSSMIQKWLLMTAALVAAPVAAESPFDKMAADLELPIPLVEAVAVKVPGGWEENTHRFAGRLLAASYARIDVHDLRDEATSLPGSMRASVLAALDRWQANFAKGRLGDLCPPSTWI